MPQEGAEKRVSCPDCRKRVSLTYSNGRWRWSQHRNRRGKECTPNDNRDA